MYIHSLRFIDNGPSFALPVLVGNPLIYMMNVCALALVARFALEKIFVVVCATTTYRLFSICVKNEVVKYGERVYDTSCMTRHNNLRRHLVVGCWLNVAVSTKYTS